MAHEPQVLFVERELGRCFCSEECITEYFRPGVEFMEEGWRKLRSEGDFTEAESAALLHYRNITLEDPDEVWVEKTETGDRHYTYIGHFRQGDLRFSYIVVCLTIEGEPSFVFLNFPTNDDALVDEYRQGEDLRVHDEEAALETTLNNSEREDEILDNPEEQISSDEDIPKELYSKFESYVEPTLDDADEIWSSKDSHGRSRHVFIARHIAEADGEAFEFNMIVVCRQKGSGLEVAAAIPSIDPGLVDRFRRGVNSLNKAFGIGGARGRAA